MLVHVLVDFLTLMGWCSVELERTVVFRDESLLIILRFNVSRWLRVGSLLAYGFVSLFSCSFLSLILFLH